MSSSPKVLDLDGCFSSEKLGDGPNAVSESTVSNIELSEIFGPRHFPRELSEFPSASQPSGCVPKQTHRVFRSTLKFAAELSEFALPKQYSRNSIPPVS